MKFQIFVLGLTLFECIGIIFIILTRCYGDPDVHKCETLYGKSVSYLLDWKWLQNLAAVLLGGASFLNAFFAFFLLYPRYKYPFWGEYWYIWGLRILHTIGFMGVAFVGVFDLNDYHDLHMMSAGWLFILLSFECELILFIPNSTCNIQKLLGCTGNRSLWTLNEWIGFMVQIIHAQLNWIFIVLYVEYDYGPYEWIGIWGILLYLNWFSRDHWNDDIHVLVTVNSSRQPIKGDQDVPPYKYNELVFNQHDSFRLNSSLKHSTL